MASSVAGGLRASTPSTEARVSALVANFPRAIGPGGLDADLQAEIELFCGN